MIASDHSRKRAAPPNPSRIRGDVCGLKWRPKNNHFSPRRSRTHRDPKFFLGIKPPQVLMPAKEKSYKNAENHDVSVSGRGGQVLR
jgi:hypothetical protein